MTLINRKYFFINKFYSNVLNNPYLFFAGNSLKQFSSLEYAEIKSNDLKKLNINKNFFINKNLKIIYTNSINDKFNSLNLKHIEFISFHGFLINNKFKNKMIDNLYFYKNNYKLIIFMIYTNINIIKYLLFHIMFKIIYILNFLKIKKN